MNAYMIQHRLYMSRGNMYVDFKLHMPHVRLLSYTIVLHTSQSQYHDAREIHYTFNTPRNWYLVVQ